MIASDIHGSIIYAKMLIERFESSDCERLVLLGDILYHGPRNDLPDGYAPKEVISLLNPLKEMLITVRGNCDTEVDQMVLDFPIMSDIAVICDEKHTIYATHGHVYSPTTPPPFAAGSVLLCGHTHVTAFERHESFTYVNPGSVSIPKENTKREYIIYENGVFAFYSLEGEKLCEHAL